MAITLDQSFEFGKNLSVVGKPFVPPEAQSVVTGTNPFTYDRLPGKKLFAAVLGCPHAHCKVKSIDTKAAEALEGVKAVITMNENPVWKTTEVLVWGWEIAAVAATDPYIAERAIDLIKVEYEVLPFILDPAEAMKPGAIKAGTFTDGNVTANPSRNTRGSIVDGFKAAEVTIEIETPFIRPHTQNTIEPCTGIAWWEGDHVYSYDQGQNPHSANQTFASQLGIPENHMHNEEPAGAGGMGGGGQTNEPVMCALLAKKAGMPVAYQRTRRLQTIRRRNHYSPKGITKLGAKKDGTLTAWQQKWYCHGGFNAATGNGMENLDCSYELPNLEQETYGVATNTGFGAGHRCLMHPEAQGTMDVALTAMSEALGMNPLQFLRKISINDTTLNQDNGQPMTCASLRTCLEAVALKSGFEQKWHKPGTKTLPDGRMHGIGISCFNDRHGTGSAGRGIILYMNTDGSAYFVTGQSNNQHGSNSVAFTCIIAETLGLPFDKVSCSSYGSADKAPDGGSQAGSTGATANGSAAQAAALDVREKMFNYAITQSPFLALKATVADLEAKDGVISLKSDPTKTITHASVMAKITKPLIGVGLSTDAILRRPFQGKPVGTTAFHRQGAASVFEVAVDTETGDVEIIGHSHTTDCGRIVDFHSSNGQIASSLWSAHGKSIMWDIHHDPQVGALLDQTFVDMKCATSMDINDDVHGGFLTESIGAATPFGMSGLGEPAALSSGPAALMSAIYNAIGGSYQAMQRPMGPERILKHLGKA